MRKNFFFIFSIAFCFCFFYSLFVTTFCENLIGYNNSNNCNLKVNFIFVSSHWNVSINLRWWLDFLGHFYRSKKLMATNRDDWCVCHFKVLEKSRMESRWLMIKLYCLLLLYKEESYDPSKYMLERENKFDWKMRRENFTYSFFRFTTYWQCFLSFLFGIFFLSLSSFSIMKSDCVFMFMCD